MHMRIKTGDRIALSSVVAVGMAKWVLPQNSLEQFFPLGTADVRAVPLSVGGCPGHCGVLSSPLDAKSTPSHDHHRCPQTWPRGSCRQKLRPRRNSVLAHLGKMQIAFWELKWLSLNLNEMKTKTKTRSMFPKGV